MLQEKDRVTLNVAGERIDITEIIKNGMSVSFLDEAFNKNAEFKVKGAEALRTLLLGISISIDSRGKHESLPAFSSMGGSDSCILYTYNARNEIALMREV